MRERRKMPTESRPRTTQSDENNKAVVGVALGGGRHKVKIKDKTNDNGCAERWRS